jgi:hypothetical protein
MSIRPRSGVQVPPLTAQVAQASNPGGTTAISVRDRLDGLWRDEDFVAWYPQVSRPGLSPAQLATVCVLQFLHALSDRQAAEAVRCRIRAAGQWRRPAPPVHVAASLVTGLPFPSPSTASCGYRTAASHTGYGSEHGQAGSSAHARTSRPA